MFLWSRPRIPFFFPENMSPSIDKISKFISMEFRVATSQNYFFEWKGDDWTRVPVKVGYVNNKARRVAAIIILLLVVVNSLFFSSFTRDVQRLYSDQLGRRPRSKLTWKIIYSWINRKYMYTVLYTKQNIQMVNI